MDTLNTHANPLLIDSSLLDSFEKLLNWSQSHFAHLPWRKSRSLYATLISEFMLQQTTVTAVIPKFINFINRYPSWEHFHQIKEQDLFALWVGLGYYSRARSLFNIAQKFKNEKDFLTALKNGLKIQGIGPYTRGALLSIGMNEPEMAIDANIKRVLSRYRMHQDTNFYKQILRHYSPRALNEALMDLGREVCQARKIACEKCYLAPNCQSAYKNPSNTKIKNTPNKIILNLHRFVLKQDALFAAIDKTKGQWLAGYLELPTLIHISTETDKNAAKQYPEITEYDIEFLKKQHLQPKQHTQTITKYLIKNHIWIIQDRSENTWHYALNLFKNQEMQWRSPESLWASSSQKILQSLTL